MQNLSNWRSVRLWESSVQKDLRSRHTLWLHGLCIGTLVLGAMWATSHLQMLLGSDSLALRYLVTLGAGYVFYLLILRLWAASLVRRESSGPEGLDGLPDFGTGPDFSAGGGGAGMQSGGGGDFAGGGASADFSGAADGGSALGDVAGGALEAVGSADEGAIVVVPVIAIFLVGCAVVFGAGSLMLLYFGWEALLTVAVEVAFSYVSARAAIRVVREGWLSAAIRLTWKPLLGALLCAVLLGGTIDYFMPTAQSLPQAIKLMKQPRP
jgi:hypothetical protein